MGGMTGLVGAGAEVLSHGTTRQLIRVTSEGHLLPTAVAQTRTLVVAGRDLAAGGGLARAAGATKLVVPTATPARAAFEAMAPERQLAHIARQRGGDAAVAALARVSNPETYFARAAGKHGVDLFTTLGEITKEGQHTIGYNPARDLMYGTLDHTGPHKELVDLYLGRLEAGVTSRATATAHDINAEHIWPQSNGATGEAKSDLHILMSSDAFTNQARWHLPFGDVHTEHWRSPVTPDGTVDRVGLDVAGNLVFEPRESIRGEVARKQLYFATRHRFDPTDGFTLDHFRQSLPSLLKWHRADPVSAEELTRDGLIGGIQYNLNPFVRHPEYVDAIGFDSPEMTKVLAGGRPGSRETIESWDRFMKNPAGYYMDKERAAKAAARGGATAAARGPVHVSTRPLSSLPDHVRRGATLLQP